MSAAVTEVLLSVPSKEAMFDFLTALNVSGEHPEVPCVVVGGGRTFLASLTDPDADYVHITSNGSSGYYECCGCIHSGEPCTEYCESRWEPTYPVTALVSAWPNSSRVAEEDYIDSWWSA